MSSEAAPHLDQDGFRLRGLHFSRVDAFSDVVFGFALTLLVVSLEVPKTFAELYQSLRGFLPFAVCFYFLMLIWREHYRFFRRFGLHDTRTLTLNSTLLFVVLFYVYPLKFLFTYAIGSLLGWSVAAAEGPAPVMRLMILFNLGFAAIYALLLAMYRNALAQRVPLDLSPRETILTRAYALDAGASVAVGLLACVAALALERWAPGYVGEAGWTYVLIGVLRPLLLRRRARVLHRVDS